MEEYLTNLSKEAVEVLRRIDEFFDESSEYREESFTVKNYITGEIIREIEEWGFDEYHFYRNGLREEYVFYCRHGGKCVIRIIIISGLGKGTDDTIIVRREPR